MVEITNNLKLLPLIMLVLLISKAVGDVFNDGFYEAQAQLRGIPLLDSRPKPYMRKMSAQEVCGKQKVECFPRIVKVSDVVAVLQANNHNGFPVVDRSQNGETVVIGLILRSYLLVLLQTKSDLQHIPVPSDTRGSLRTRHSLTDFVKPVSSKGLSIDDIHLTQDEMEMYIDLKPFVNPSPYIVPEDMSLSKVYNIFRQLGLRHIFVVPRPSRILGVITRKDLLLPENQDRDSKELPQVSVRQKISKRGEFLLDH
eukprot:TRINITY_DN12597_c0_g1_i1.p1 TRINITY_DN12597_c0_g1~~TRINITY_DN12597_c0_g1_i1.p1  ORF type:complete len:280 (-),score=58.48 TRINITY_DN12597_c0_g1_i1:54-818(-)